MIEKRERFELWLRSENIPFSDVGSVIAISSFRDYEYNDIHTELLWKTFKAGWERSGNNGPWMDH
jgi:DNA polymerase III psi subunit